MEFFNNIIKGLEVILVLYFSLTLNVPLNQEGKIESKKYWEFNISIPANTSTGSPKPWNWNLKFSNLQGQNFSISSSSAGASYTHIEKMEVDPIY